MIDDLALARVIHVLALVHWIGGVAVVTTIVLPRAHALLDAHEAVAAFEAFEQRFASQVRISILLAGLSAPTCWRRSALGIASNMHPSGGYI